MVIVSAQYQLPHHIWVETAVLGSRFDTYIGAARATVVTPAPEGLADSARQPSLKGVPVSAWDPATPWTTTYAAFNVANATALRHIGLELREDGRDVPVRFLHQQNQENRIADYTANIIAEWFAGVEDWVSVVTGEDINHRQPVFDANVIGPGLQLWRGGKWRDGGFRVMTPRPQPLSAVFLQAILDRVADGEQPPVEHQLRRDSLGAFRRRDFRKAVLDAATSVERCLIVLIGKIEQRTGNKCTARSIVSRSNWLVRHEPSYQPHSDLNRLADCRNAVIHAGESASESDARSAVEVSIAVVDALGASRDPRQPVSGL
ncbi:hypothetical protein [Nocardia pseudovaccinii]|uniref:hypothetical protein n=1 Tax=Nocardia pseudovaccinii TaxID=189540 RepID=UPI0007A51A75|nr:hypothetical protein [Nocardia pseudovaccinii]